MNILANVNESVPSGFYCQKGKKRCLRMKRENQRPYCELFYPYLEEDSEGKVVKCEKCLLAERTERVNA